MRKIFTIGSIVMSAFIGIVVICLIAFIIKPQEKVNAAEEYTLTVNKVSTISVYVSGQGVKLKDSTLDVDTYIVEENTEVTIRAINESRIFKVGLLQMIIIKLYLKMVLLLISCLLFLIVICILQR